MTQKLDIGNFSAGEVGKQINIGLLGFKMAVNDSLTVFNLVDGVVDEILPQMYPLRLHLT